jgi:hypothetical protein
MTKGRYPYTPPDLYTKYPWAYSTSGEWSRNWYTPEKLAFLRQTEAARVARESALAGLLR